MSKISQNLSCNSIFHFLSRREWLMDILKDKFIRARYVHEELPFFYYRMGIPMKCFCDIPLGMVKKHISKYGKFGLGISKNFAKSNGISPVIYIHEKSDSMLRYLINSKYPFNIDSPDSLLPYIKLYDGVNNNKKRLTRYYDEREWRWIPKGVKFYNLSDLTDDETEKILNFENKKLKKQSNSKLPFDYSDITYLFVQQDKDVEIVIEEIKKTKIEQILQDRLISKIITSAQIEYDF